MTGLTTYCFSVFFVFFLATCSRLSRISSAF